VFLSTLPSVPGEVIATRLANRMARQQRVLFREDPPWVSCIVDHVALYRGVGSPEIMAAQMRHVRHEAHCYIACLTGRDERSCLWI
jgi:hypothetical protein